MQKITFDGGSPGPPLVKIERNRQTYFLGVYRRGRLHCVKIGLCTKGKVQTRLRTLQCGSADRLELLAVISGNVERKLHRDFHGYRMTEGGKEFFRPAPKLLRLIEDLKKVATLVEEIERRNPNFRITQ
jgi:hypothetical protein